MHKSTIPFNFDNLLLDKIFIEVANEEKISQLFYLKKMELEKIKNSKAELLVTDHSTLKKILKQNIKLNKIFLIGNSSKENSDLNIYKDIININIPFKIIDIYQRIENYLTQHNMNKKRLLKFKYFTYDPSTRKLTNNLLSLRFTEKESQIFTCLVENENSHISKKNLLSKVWSYGEGIDTHTLETHVYALRKKIETKLKMKDLIMFEEKKGYYLNKSIL